MAHDKIIKDMQGFLEYKKGTKIQKKASFGPAICCFLAKCYQTTIFVYSNPFARTTTRRSKRMNGFFKLSITVYFYHQDDKVHVELLKDINAYPTEQAICLHQQYSWYWEWPAVIWLSVPSFNSKENRLGILIT